MSYPLDVMGPGEVADHCHVDPRTVSRWQAEGSMPEPDQVLKRINLWRGSTIRRWQEKRVAEIRERLHV